MRQLEILTFFTLRINFFRCDKGIVVIFLRVLRNIYLNTHRQKDTLYRICFKKIVEWRQVRGDRACLLKLDGR